MSLSNCRILVVLKNENGNRIITCHRKAHGECHDINEPGGCRNMATRSVSLMPSYSFIVLTHGAMAFAMAHLIVT